MNSCICCHDRLLRHISNHRTYWFCPTCHQKMPSVGESVSTSHPQQGRIQERNRKMSKVF